MNLFTRSRSIRMFLPLLVAGLSSSIVLPSYAQQVTASPAASVTDATPLPVKIVPQHPLIRYVGRFDRRKPAGPRCSWSASRIAVRFDGAALNVTLADTGDNDAYQVVVDGKQVSTLKLSAGSHRYALLRDGTAGPHTVELIKRTEGFFGVTRVEGFELPANGKLLPLPRAARRIEIVGDSISCGYGNEASDEKQRFSSATENAYQTYGSVAARVLDAELVCVAWSGRRMAPTNTMNEVYGRALATDADSTWDFSQWTPDVVIVTLGTNDFAGGSPDRAGWIAGYREFLARVRKNYPKAAIYCATSPMMWGDPAKVLREYLDEIVRQERGAGHSNVRLLPFATQDAKNGFGADWHPSVATHQIMADKLVAALNNDLGWKPRPK